MNAVRPATPGVATPEEPYVQAVRAGDSLYLAGQVAFDERNEVVGPGDARAQIEQCWRNVERIVAAQGGTLHDVVKVVCYFTDIRHFPLELEVRRRLFGDGPYPVATVMQVANLGLDTLLVEIDATAVLGACPSTRQEP
jgi:enamine deaminase RidA (YjgF/YER057c/UK114 family)